MVYIVQLCHVISRTSRAKKGTVTRVCPTTHNNNVQNK